MDVTEITIAIFKSGGEMRDQEALVQRSEADATAFVVF
jgi:hypothetical protein